MQLETCPICRQNIKERRLVEKNGSSNFTLNGTGSEEHIDNLTNDIEQITSSSRSSSSFKGESRTFERQEKHLQQNGELSDCDLDSVDPANDTVTSSDLKVTSDDSTQNYSSYTESDKLDKRTLPKL